jgi:hypothetical protein
MMFSTFGAFLDKKKREAVKQLGLIDKLLRSQGMKVENYLKEEDDPYIFCFNPSRMSSFDGIRIYKVGDNIAFRVQKESRTHPFGKSYPLDLEAMYNDLLTDEGVNEGQAGKKIIEAVAKELTQFFEKSMEAEKEMRMRTLDDEQSAGQVAARPQVTDFGNMIYAQNK